MPTKRSAYRFTDEDKSLLKRIMKSLGLDETATLRKLIRDKAKRLPDA